MFPAVLMTTNTLVVLMTTNVFVVLTTANVSSCSDDDNFYLLFCYLQEAPLQNNRLTREPLSCSSLTGRT